MEAGGPGVVGILEEGSLTMWSENKTGVHRQRNVHVGREVNISGNANNVTNILLPVSLLSERTVTGDGWTGQRLLGLHGTRLDFGRAKLASLSVCSDVIIKWKYLECFYFSVR